MKKLISALAVTAALGAAAPASAVVVGGIDFGTLPTGVHLETATLAQTFINPLTTAPGTGAGTAYGLITTINGDTTYCAGGGSNCALYYVGQYSGGTFNSATNITFTSNEIKLYYSNAAPVNLLANNSPANVAFIQGLTPWASLTGHGNLSPLLPANVVINANGTLSGVSLNLSTTGLLDVNLADGFGNASVEAFLNGDGIADAAGGFADIAYTDSSNNFVLNQNDLSGGFATGCLDGTAATGAWCWQGTLNIRGVANVPEPGTMALLALGLMGAGLTVRRRRTQD